MTRLDEIKARHMATTPGPWKKIRKSNCWAIKGPNHGVAYGLKKNGYDVDFMVHAHDEDIPYLLAEVACLTEDLKDYVLLETIRRNRLVTSSWVKYWREKEGKGDTWYPDWGEIYTDWEDRGKEIERLTAERDVALRRAEAAEPRVLTLREVQCYQDCPVIWVETIGNSDWRYTNDIINYYAHPDSKKAKDYGVTWRCWTGKPTAVQAINADWQGGPGDED